ncbi:MAG: hypothetical protein K9J16_17760 [Melioribacteraceae bacterium]|nr:hypothetical protein [Melioribacteraceae bacterium]MCF8356731.1 hypothetical protein [Melioribacteraceae bacterium]MCF8396085.1 hypothetical protein [Melioribacteraceae bacterium]MCF8421071.1 hypothetical protein [Melioribacteraceae bacterium]
MKKIFAVLLTFVFLIAACSQEEKKLELFSPEAFAFQLDSGWELNGSVQIKGFAQKEEDDNYTAKLSYYSNLITPAGDTLNEVDYGMIDEYREEEMMDVSLDIQIELDSSFSAGSYKLIYFVSDDISNQQAMAEAQFTLDEF